MNYLRHWWWMWAMHGLLVWVMYQYFFFGNEKWFRQAYTALGLSREMNYAAWWSGICLFFAAIIYLKIARVYAAAPGRQHLTWFILGAFSIALSMDEIGSIHETVAQHGGWQALAPFVMVFGGAFLYGVSRLLTTPDMRFPGIMILVSVLIFAGVAGLEFVEHNFEFDGAGQRIRLITEEGIELFAIGLMVSAGILA